MNLQPNDIIRVLLPANSIPDGSTVSKRQGEVISILRHNLKVYSDQKGKEPLIINGLFLCGDRGQINQIQSATLLHWHITSQDFITTLEDYWEPVLQ